MDIGSDVGEEAEAGSSKAAGSNWTDPTEDAVALAFAEKYRNRLVFDHTAAKWHEWRDGRWARDTKACAFDMAREFTRQVHAGLVDPPIAMTKIGFAAAVERAARADPRIAVDHTVWDTDPWLLGVPSGVVNLRTGEVLKAAPDLYISRQTSVAPAATADCPLWLAFLREATGNDAAYIGFLKRWFGYSLTGITREHALLFVYGPGGNGKGVLLNTAASILGEYAVTAAMDTFTASHGDRHPADLAMLQGARMVMTTETEEGRPWAEARIKALTGGDPITARFMRQDFFTFTPAFKLTISGNHKPTLRNVDDAARRRVNIGPFLNKPAVPDKTLSDKLKAEAPGILRWMVEGCIEWQRDGLNPPKAVTDATSEYFREQDIFRQWMDDCCEMSSGERRVSDTHASLLASWRNYARAAGEEAGSSKRFSATLVQFGLEPVKDSDGIRGRGFKGIKVKVATATETPPADGYDGCGDRWE